MEQFIKEILANDIPIEMKIALIEEELTSGRPRKLSDSTAVVLLAIRLIKFGSSGECSVGWAIVKLFKLQHRERLEAVLTADILPAIFQKPRSINEPDVACLLELLGVFIEVSEMPGAETEIANLLIMYLNENEITKSDLDLTLEFFSKYPLCAPRGFSVDTFSGVLVKALAAFSMPEKSNLIADYSDEMKSFIEKLGKCLCRGQDTTALIYILVQKVFMRISNPDVCPDPSPALAFILQLVPSNLVSCSIEIINGCLNNESLSRAICVLCDWLILSPKASQLPEWIVGFLFNLTKKNNLEVINYIAYETLKNLFSMLIIPVMRGTVLPVVVSLLIATRATSDVFFLIVPKVPLLIHHLKQENTPSSRRTLKNIVDTVNMLMERHPSNRAYVRIIRALQALEDANHRPSTSSNSPSTNTTIKSILDKELRISRSNRVGLANFNNTCYMNSVLQALFMTKRFCDSILGKNKVQNSPALDALQVLFALLLHSERPSLLPDAIWKLTKPPHFQKGRQQDSYEYMMSLFDMVEKEENLIKNESFTEQHPFAIDLRTSSVICSSNEENSAKFIYQSEHTFIAQPNEASSISFHKVEAGSKTEDQDFGIEMETDLCDGDHVPGNTHEIFLGKICTTYKCVECNSRSSHKDLFTDLQLCFPNDIAENKEPVSIQNLLDLYFQPEDLQGDNLYACSNCRDLKEGLKTIEISSPPSHLIIILKVFAYDYVTGMRKKLLPKVQCSSTIHISASDSDGIKDEEYHLYAIVAHKGGSVDAGHYVTFAQDESNTWFYFNDELVEETSFEEITNKCCNHTPYMLFYQKTTEKFQVGVNGASLADLKPHLIEIIRRENLRYRNEIQPKKRTTKRVHPKDDDFDPPSSCGGGMGLGKMSNHCVF